MTKVMRQEITFRWGMRRADGEPWRTEPRFEGDTGYYVRGDEVTEDGMVFPFYTLEDFVTSVFAQMHDPENDNPHPGEVVPMEYKYASGDYEDIDWSLFRIYANRYARGHRQLDEWLIKSGIGDGDE